MKTLNEFDLRAWITYWSALLVFLVAVSFLVGCDSSPSYQTTPKDQPYDTYGGIGMGFNGQLGIELAPGLILGFDGGLTPGFGF